MYPCVSLAKGLGIPLVDGHLFVRHPTSLRAVFGQQARLLLQHGNNDVCPTWSNVRRTIVKSLRQIVLQVLAEKGDTLLVQELYAKLLSVAKRCWKGQHITVPWIAWE